jgi:hypothetical protein
MKEPKYHNGVAGTGKLKAYRFDPKPQPQPKPNEKGTWVLQGNKLVWVPDAQNKT